VRYSYDALGRRIKEGSTELYYSKDWQVLEERNGSNAPVARYVWSPVYVDALVLRDRDADGNGSLEERLYVLADANYNVTALVNTSGSVVERYVYDPYGRFDVKDASWGTRANSSYVWVYLHQGGRWDATEAMFSFRNRDYSPTLMRWASVDPIGFTAKDFNTYRYVRDDPTIANDPQGLFIVNPIPILWDILFPGNRTSPPSPPVWNYNCPHGEQYECVSRLGPGRCLRIRELADEARSAAESSALPGASGGEQDAFRHCMASCRITQELGAGIAAIAGDIHEYCTPENMPWHPNYKPGDWAMDHHNNAEGRECGRRVNRADTREDLMMQCRLCCGRKLREGKLVTSVNPNAPIPPDTQGPPRRDPPRWRGPKLACG
jgi:RHS repeat-associated protein